MPPFSLSLRPAVRPSLLSFSIHLQQYGPCAVVVAFFLEVKRPRKHGKTHPRVRIYLTTHSERVRPKSVIVKNKHNASLTRPTNQPTNQPPCRQVLGVVGGTVGLFEQSTVEITDDLLSAYRNQGGFDLLGRSVDSIRTDAEMTKAKEACAALDLDGLVVSAVFFVFFKMGCFLVVVSVWLVVAGYRGNVW